MSDDIVTRLRRIGPDVYGPAAVLAATEAANEIERLQRRQMLTDAEREALRMSVLEWNDSNDKAGWEVADTLQALLDRMK